MPSRKRLRVSEVNPHLICVLCGGYYIDATTITECLHTFCKTCIVGYLEASKHCPVCDNLVHKTKPHLRLRPDHTLQDLVYKLVPGLFQDEMSKRRDFYKEEIESGKLGENGTLEERERIIYSGDETISLVLELSPDGSPPCNPGSRTSKQLRLEAADQRYLKCPGNIPISILKKFIRMKFNLCDRYQVDFYHTDEILFDHYTLVDVAYIYSWRRKGPLRLYYTVFTNPAKRFKIYIEDSVPMETETDSKTELSDSKAETSGYVTDDDRCLSELEKSLDLSVDADKNDGEHPKVARTSEINGVTTDTCDKPQQQTKDSDESSVVNGKKTVVPVNNSNAVESTTESKMNVLESSEDSGEKETNSAANKAVHKRNDECKSEGANLSSHTDKDSDKPNKISDISKGKVQSNSETRDPLVSINSDINKVHDSPSKVEISTCTSPVESSPVFQKDGSKSIKSRKLEDDISEPVVSSTQNTQGCQTEPTEESSISKSNVSNLHSSDVSDDSNDHHEPVHQKTTVDKCCETDNIVLARQISCESVSVSTETENTEDKNNERIKGVEKCKGKVDCSTDVFDFPNTDIRSDKNRTVACLAELSESSKRKTLSVDCSTGVDDIQAGYKRKLDMLSSGDMKIMKKTDSKGPKRSYSYGGHLSAAKPAYLSEPLSPTKITLKVSAPKSPVKSPPKSPSKAEPSGFQSQYQSFVMEMPDTSYRFEEDGPVKTSKHNSLVRDSQPYFKQNQYQSLSHSITLKRSQSKSNRPRGRPPKVKNPDEIDAPREKKHKSRSHSPKHRKSSGDKHTDVSKDNSTDKQIKISAGNPYSWINKLDGKYTSEKKVQKAKTEISCSEKSDLKIPKQVLIFSNGQYTLSTASSLTLLKQSSPVSPPKTVSSSESPVSSAEKHVKLEKQKDKKVVKSDSNSDNDRKDKKPVIKIVTAKSDQSETLSKYSENSLKKDYRETLKIDSNQNRIFPQTSIVSSSTAASSSVPISKLSISIPSASSVTTASSESAKTSAADSKTTAATPTSTSKVTEYRHQSPFFASISGAKLGTPHRSSTHLNIPNLNSHFSGTHHLYSHSRYSMSRHTQPMYRSLSANDKHSSLSTTMVTLPSDIHRLEGLSSSCSYLSPFNQTYLGLAHIHSHLMSKLPSQMPSMSMSPDSTKSSPPSASSPSPSSMSMLNQNNNRHSILPRSNNSSRKEKGKSLNTIISEIKENKERAITESNTSAQEQLNGIDLSTKSSRQSEKTNFSEDKALDKFAFTDDDNIRSQKEKKSEPSLNKSVA